MLEACLGVVGKRIPPSAPPLPWVMGVPVITGKTGGLGVHGLSLLAALSVSESSSDSARHRKYSVRRSLHSQ